MEYNDASIKPSVSDEVKDLRDEMSASDIESLYAYTLAQRYKAALRIANSPSGVRYGVCSKDDIPNWLIRPAAHEKQLRSASRYMYERNGQYRRLCNYQPNMIKFSYVIYPANKHNNLSEEEKAKYKDAYCSTAAMLDNMSIATEFRRPLKVAAREGAAFCYAREESDSFCLHIMDADYCRASSFDMYGCIHYEFDFRYFDMFNSSDRQSLLNALGTEFIEKYALYCEDRLHKAWQEINPYNGLCIKWDSDILHYSTPPYIAVLDTLFDIEDYKKLAKAKEEAGNYNLMGFTIPTTKDGKILMDLGLAKKFIDQASSELPSTIGVLLSPMQMEKFNFSKPSAVADQNAVADAEEQFWSASGVPSLLFGASKSSTNALSKSIIADEINVFPLVQQIERWINRRLSIKKKKYKFKVRFLDVTAFNQSDMFDMTMKAGNAGLPVKNALASILGLTPHESIAMAELENDVLQMRDIVFNQPLVNSSTMTSNDVLENKGGRPMSDDDDLSDKGEITRETEGNIRE